LNTLFSAFQFTKTKTEEQVGKKKTIPKRVLQYSTVEM